MTAGTLLFSDLVLTLILYLNLNLILTLISDSDSDCEEYNERITNVLPS